VSNCEFRSGSFIVVGVAGVAGNCPGIWGGREPSTSASDNGLQYQNSIAWAESNT
jgi:hypothetical protein